MEFRLANSDDLLAIAGLHATSWQQSYQGIMKASYLRDQVLDDRADLWRERLACPDNHQYLCLALENDELCGFICMFGDNHPEYGSLVDNLHVAAKCKGQGLGTQLLKLGAHWSLQAFPDAPIYLEVLADNTAAQGFYRHLGAVVNSQKYWNAPCGSKIKEFVYLWSSPQRLVKLSPQLLAS